jgi:hypothetical protein
MVKSGLSLLTQLSNKNSFMTPTSMSTIGSFSFMVLS